MCVGTAFFGTQNSSKPSNTGLYIHIPWCISLCNYCVFFTQAFRRPDFEEYFAALLKEKALYQKQLQRPLTSIYFGGGTPSLLSGEMIRQLLEGLNLAENAEISLEMNPLQVQEKYLKDLQDSGVNRISLGVQSLHDAELRFLSRRHRADQIPAKIALLRDFGFANFSMDLIYGLPHRSLADLAENLDRFLALEPPHLSCYLLEIPDDSRILNYRAQLPADELLAEAYHLILAKCAENGLLQYEISNFARVSHQSRHNLLYWKQENYLAWGAAASGFYEGIRYTNPANLEAYYQNLEAGQIFPDGITEDEMPNYIMMRLRLREGLYYQDFEQRFAEPFGREKALAKLQKYGMIEFFEGGFRLSEKALFVSSAVIGELI